MKVKELNLQGTTELKEELLALRREQFNLRMQQASGQLAKGHLIKNARRNIARVKTALNAKKTG